ncbi:VRR-NUC domain-containing protein [Vibrio hannami]|uniref:VRR-NUC domain-containing protein n=1 Tax=Vibrio hannami TaxID=2717094 RepID=UPI00240FDF95|nr:VRR-NUC domain-containing protein [Vibrio hannami]MDG3085718.1 VRR-NUC domain-containing protein [Vibrio hannami]
MKKEHEIESVQLSQHYYRDNFRKLTSHALLWYRDLLNEKELDWIVCFENLTSSAQCLLVRLISRKGPYFRSDKLTYPEIEDLQTAAKLLSEQGFLEINPTLEFSIIAEQLLTKPELLALFPEQNRSARKSQIIDDILKEIQEPAPQLPFDIYLVREHHIIDVLSLLFFANTRQDITQFVVSDLGIQRFESYSLDKKLRFFQSREQIDALLTISLLTEQFHTEEMRDEVFLDNLLTLLPSNPKHPYVTKKTDRLINLIAREYERIGAHEKALNWFMKNAVPPSKERRVRILDNMERDAEAKSLVSEMLTAPYDISEFEVASRLDSRLRRKSGERISRAKPSAFNEQNLTLDLSSLRVELAVQARYKAQGWQAFYTENALLNALFGLAFWDIIFTPIEGAFINPYQHQPLDLYQPEFETRRRSLISNRLIELNDDHKKLIRMHFEQKQGIANTLVNWSVMTKELLRLCLRSFSAEQLISLFEIQLSDLKHYRSGMPDLIAFKDDQFLWIEVKGPGDKLQDSQKRWIQHFDQLEIPYVVCYVQAI